VHKNILNKAVMQAENIKFASLKNCSAFISQNNEWKKINSRRKLQITTELYR
jgi:hypothetical protein